MNKYSIESTTLTNIADAIREKTGGNEEIKVEDMAGKIGEISGGSVETCTVTVINTTGWGNSSIILVSATVYENGIYSTKYLEKTTGIIENVVCGSAICAVSSGNISAYPDNNAEYITSISLGSGYCTLIKAKQSVVSTTIDFIL